MPSSRLITGRTIRPRKTVVYGDGGVGKSTWATSAPGSVTVPTEDGLADIGCVRYPVARTYAEFEDNCRDLYQNAAEFGHAVVDSADWLYSLCVAEVLQTSNKSSIEEFGYGVGWKLADERFIKALRILDALHAKGLGIIVIAHAQVTRFADPSRESYDRWEPKLRKDAREKLVEWADEVFFAAFKVYTQAHDVGFNRTEVKATGTGERVLYTTAKPSHVAKNRLGMPDEIPMTWADYARYFPAPAASAAVEPAPAA
jgi:hypothetical protein